MAGFKTGVRRISSAQLFMPLMILFLLVIVNLFIGGSFFRIVTVVDNYGNTVLSGDIVSIINGASELALLVIGMTLVTAASGGQDISVGAVSAIAGAVFVKVVTSGQTTILSILFAFIVSCVVVMLCGALNGTLVAVFRIQPMIATLILFTAGRSVAYWINGTASPKLYDDFTRQIGSFISGVPIQTPIFIVILFLIIFALIFKFTNIRLYIESVGINQKSARLNGINPIAVKLAAYVALGFCVAAAGFISTCRMQRLDHLGILNGIEMDAILAVAIGGNALSGGKFSITGSVIGAYTIELLTKTLLRMQVDTNAIKVYKAVFIILLMLASSPTVKDYAVKLLRSLRVLLRGETQREKGGLNAEE